MERIYKKLSILLLIIIIISSNSTMAANNKDRYFDAEELGELLGYNDGLLEGLRNYSNDLKLPYYEIRPTIDEIGEEYKDYLHHQDNTYRSYFLSAYYAGFEKGYNEGIKTGDDQSTTKDNYSKLLGLTLGEIYGHRDSYDNKKANGTKALPSDKRLIEMYSLDQLTSQDRYEFLREFKQKFQNGYQEGYRKAHFESIKVSYEEGVKDGEYFGNILGRTYGAKDYFNNRARDYKRDIPSNRSIQREYALNKDGQEYREGFLIGFRRAYEESYNEAFRTMNTDIHIRLYEQGYLDGKEAGKIKGGIYATKDFHLKLTNNWKRYYPTQGEIIREYDLSLESARFRDGFTIGYIEGLSQGYMTGYQQLNRENIGIKALVKNIPISGGEITSLDNIFSLNIEKGTYYAPVIVTIDMSLESFSKIDERFIKASDSYRVSIVNQLGEVNNKNTIELKFEYYGGNDGGIYKLVNGRWLYMPSIIEDGFIKTKVKPSSFNKDNVYCVLIDKKATLLLDTRSHWAKDEILTFQRRDIISGYTNKTFKPDNAITKGEFFTIISKVYNWQLPKETETNLNEKIINYALDKGFIDKPSKANEQITYEEVDNVMRKITNSKDYHWSNFASKALYEKLYRSSSFSSKNNHITRAETVYMLYTLNEWKY